MKQNLKEFVNERLKVKKDSITFQKKWIKSKSCRRNLILEYFEEADINGKVKNCCDICGINLGQYQAAISDQTTPLTEKMWKDYLANMLLNSELSE